MYVVAIKNCSACGGTHLGMPTYELDKPHVISRINYYVYSVCPNTGIHVYVEMEEKVVADRSQQER